MMEGNDTARKLAFCGALVAGIAYFGITILKDTFAPSQDKANRGSGKPKRRNSDTTDSARHNSLSLTSFHPIAHASSQTDLTLPIGPRERLTAWKNIPPELWAPWAKSIQERIRELNMRMVNSTHLAYNHAKSNNFPQQQLPPTSSYLSLQNTPKNSPRVRSPIRNSIPCNLNTLSQSSENLRPESSLSMSSSRSNIGLPSIRSLCIPSETEILIHKRTLDRLYDDKNTARLSQQEASSLTVLLLGRDEDMLVKTLSVIANCAAFTTNIDPICDSGSVLLLTDLLEHDCCAVQVAATHAVANIACGEKAQELLKDCVLILARRVKLCTNELQLKWTLVALANLALKDANHFDIIPAIDCILHLLSHSSLIIRLQSIKLLVNLSSNSDIVPYLLAAKSPYNLYSLLDFKCDGEVLLRLCHFLANVIECTSMRDIKPQELPPQYKAASPETLYSAIFGFGSSEMLLEKLRLLESGIKHDETLFQIKRILRKVR